MPEPRPSFAVLLERARRGEQSALAELARQYEPEVRLVARLRLSPALRPYLDSIDLVQSVHKSLMLGLKNDKFDIASPEQLVALALEVVRRKVARHWRHLQRQQRFDAPGDPDQKLSSLLKSLSSAETDPARKAQIDDAVEHLYRQLAPAEKRVLEMRLEGFSTAEIARALNLDADVLRVHLSRLRRRLRADGVLTEWL